MYDQRRLRARVGIGLDVRHHVVPDGLFVAVAAFQVDIRLMGFEFVHLLLHHRQAKVVLRLRENDPKPSPQPGTVRF